MQQNGSPSPGRAIFKGRFFSLLIFLLIMLAIQPLDEVIGRYRIFVDITVTAILVSAIYAISQKKTHAIAGILLAIPVLASIWVAYFFTYPRLQMAGIASGIVFFAFIIILCLRFIFSRDEITTDLIAGAAVVYLLAAVMWAYAYSLIEIIRPGSFAVALPQSLGERASFLYYSFVTITTLGYGDIFPATTAAKSCAILEAVIGQLYLVITVAWLVGIHISQSLAKKSSSDKS